MLLLSLHEQTQHIHTGTLDPDVVVVDLVSAADMSQLRGSMQTPPKPSFKKMNKKRHMEEVNVASIVYRQRIPPQTQFGQKLVLSSLFDLL